MQSDDQNEAGEGLRSSANGSRRVSRHGVKILLKEEDFYHKFLRFPLIVVAKAPA
jgi:hypothetical protein